MSSHPEHVFDKDGDDHALAAAAMCGDRAAIDRLWHEHRRWIAAVLLAHKAATTDLEDLLQEVAATMVEKIHTLRDPANIRAWLRTVSINAARGEGRSVSNRRETPLNGSGHVAHCPDGIGAEEADELKRIGRLLEQLDEAYREPLLLRAVHGLRSRQIAAIMGISEATVDTRVARARRMLLTLADNRAGNAHSQQHDDSGKTSEQSEMYT